MKGWWVCKLVWASWFGWPLWLEECCSRVIWQNCDGCDSQKHHHLGGNGNSGHFQVLIKKLRSRAKAELEYDRRTVNQWAVVSTNIHLLPHLLDEAWCCLFPTPHHQFPHPCVDFFMADLCEDVSKHVSCYSRRNGYGSTLNFVAKVRMLDVDIPNLLAHPGILDTGSHVICTTVILKDTTMMPRRCCLQFTPTPLRFLNQLHEWKHLQMAIEIVKYSASVVDNGISVWSLKAHMTGYDA